MTTFHDRILVIPVTFLAAPPKMKTGTEAKHNRLYKII